MSETTCKNPEYQIVRMCCVCKEATENVDERLCENCKRAIMFVRKLIEKGDDDEDNSAES